MAANIYVMRHGQTVMNAAGLLAGKQSETPLSDTGKQQAAEAAEFAKSLGIKQIVCSTQGRARETAAIIAAGLGLPATAITYSDALIERDFGELEGAPWSPDLSLKDVKGLESETSLLARAADAYRTIAINTETTLIVTHGSTARALQCAAGLTKDFHRTKKLENAEILQLR